MAIEDDEIITPEDVALVKEARAGMVAVLPQAAPDHLIISVEDKWPESEGGKVLTIAGLSRAQVYILARILENENSEHKAGRDLQGEWGVGPKQEDDFAGYAKARAQYVELLQTAGMLKATIS